MLLCNTFAILASKPQNDHFAVRFAVIKPVILFPGGFPMMTTQIRRIPLLVSVLVVLLIALLLSLSLLLSFGALAGIGGSGPNGVTNGSMINPDGLAAGSGMDGNGHS
jgi:hypothetical protein